jgi:ATP:corrinoid adenosyltransferase
MNYKGLLLVYTGDGKGKTTAALGMALRAAGHGMKVLILQFMKCREKIGEIKALTRTDLPITLTGRNAKEKLIAMADLVSEIREIKHHYHQGVQAQKGIEF